jgi:hypothetical protein
LQNFVASRKVSAGNCGSRIVCVYFCVYDEEKDKFLRDIELPEGIVPVGSLLDAIVRMDIESCGEPTIWEHAGIRYIQPSQGCPPKKLQRLHRAYKREVERLAREHGVEIDPQSLDVTIAGLRNKQGVRLPELHTCQTGVLWLGPHHTNTRRATGAPDDRPSWIVEAEKKLTKYPYSLLFSLIRLVTEPRPGDTLDAYVPPNKVIEWCSTYGLPDTEESHMDERYGCLQLKTFQAEIVRLYLLFHLWKSVIEWRDFEEVSGPSDPEETERRRGAIHRYASLLLKPGKGGSSVLEWAMNCEQAVKRQLDRGIYVSVNQKTKKEVDLKKEYKAAKAKVDHVAQVVIDEEVHTRIRLDQYFSGATGQMMIVAKSVFAACYLQLAELRLKPRGEVVRHLKYCTYPACGWVFWAPHGHNNFCEKHFSRGARHAAKKRSAAKNLKRIQPSVPIL